MYNTQNNPLKFKNPPHQQHHKSSTSQPTSPFLTVPESAGSAVRVRKNRLRHCRGKNRSRSFCKSLAISTSTARPRHLHPYQHDQYSANLLLKIRQYGARPYPNRSNTDISFQKQSAEKNQINSASFVHHRVKNEDTAKLPCASGSRLRDYSVFSRFVRKLLSCEFARHCNSSLLLHLSGRSRII